MGNADGLFSISEFAALTGLPEEVLRGKVGSSIRKQDYFSIQELADRWRCSRGTVYNRLRAEGAGSRYCADLFVENQRIRGPLGVRRLSEAERLVKLLEEAISEGPSSAIWDELHGRVPADTLHRFSEFVGVTAQHVPTWDDLVAAFRNETGQRIALGAMAASTSQRYGVTIREFGEFLNAAGISELRQIDKPLVERFKVWRVARIKAKKFARGATGLALDAAILHRIFN